MHYLFLPSFMAEKSGHSDSLHEIATIKGKVLDTHFSASKIKEILDKLKM
jgi:glycerol kinase